MTNKRKLVGLLVCLSLFVPCSMEGWAGAKVHEFMSLSFPAPHGMMVSRQEAKNAPRDFTVFEFSSKGRLIMYCYLGGAPEFPKSTQGQVKTGTINGYALKTVQYTKNGNYNGEYLIQFSDAGKNKNTRPKFAHIVYEDAKPEDLRVITQFIKSFRIRKK